LTGALKRRATPSHRPAALTRLGARKVNEIVNADVTLAAGLPCGDAVDRRGTGIDFGQPLPSPCDCSDELDRGVSADREGLWLVMRLRSK
jgi:hypothetical protein